MEEWQVGGWFFGRVKIRKSARGAIRAHSEGQQASSGAKE